MTIRIGIEMQRLFVHDSGRSATIERRPAIAPCEHTVLRISLGCTTGTLALAEALNFTRRARYEW